MISPLKPFIPSIPTIPFLGKMHLDHRYTQTGRSLHPVGLYESLARPARRLAMPGDPMYKLIADDLRKQIESGDLQTGQQLPTELQLQVDYQGREEFSDNVSRNTIRDAVSILVAEGLVEKRPGQGTFVIRVDPIVTTLSGNPHRGGTDELKSQIERLDHKPELTTPRIEMHGAPDVPVLAPDLALEEGEQVLSRHQRSWIDRRPFMMQTSFYPMDFAVSTPQLLIAQDIPEGAVEKIRETLGIEQVGWHDEIRIRPPTGDEAKFFNLPPGRAGVQVIEVRRTAFDQGARPVRLTVTTYPADRTRVAYNVGKTPFSDDGAT
jgi:GntR family transcriptional regulator